MSTNKERKFLFDYNNFDLPDTVPEPEVYVEPPPLFSLDELGFAKDDAYAKGHASGMLEAKKQREQYLAEQMERISQELKFLTGAENYRAAVYEREVLSLTETIFKTVFPHFTETQGLDELKAVISKVVANLSEQSAIIIEVPAEDADAITSYMETRADIDFTKVTIKPSAQIPVASCRMTWQDGGALRDHMSIADEVLKALQRQKSPAPTAETSTDEAETAPAASAALANTDEKDQTEHDSQGD